MPTTETTATFYGFPQMEKHRDQKWRSQREQMEQEGFFILENVIDQTVLAEAIPKLEQVYATQLEEIGGLENMKRIKEENTIRLPFVYDTFFLQFFSHPTILEVLKAVYCDQFILLTQAGLINEPQKHHVGGQWHKDLPYQHYASQQPICINALFPLTDFHKTNGATFFIKGSHQYTGIPDEATRNANQIQIQAKAGDVIFFNSLLIHKMGENTSNAKRYALNHMFGTPIFKQHANFHKLLNGKYAEDPLLGPLLDYPYAVPDSIVNYRKNKLAKTTDKP